MVADRVRIDIAAKVRAAMDSRGMRAAVLASATPGRNRATIYRTLAGETADPWTSTLLTICGALGTHPDELLDMVPAALEPDVQALYEEATHLEDGDKGLVVALMRSLQRRPRESMARERSTRRRANLE